MNHVIRFRGSGTLIHMVISSAQVAVDALYECKASAELIAAFGDRAARVICSDEQVLFQHGQPAQCVYLILSGKVDLLLPLTSMDGMGFRAHAGSFVGLPAAFSNAPYTMTAIAQENAELAMMSRDKFCDLIATNHALALDVLKILAAETRSARIAIVEAEIGRRSPETQKLIPASDRSQ